MEKYEQTTLFPKEKPADAMPSSTSWNLWHGCHKCSPGCWHCYVYRRDRCRNTGPVHEKANTNILPARPFSPALPLISSLRMPMNGARKPGRSCGNGQTVIST